MEFENLKNYIQIEQSIYLNRNIKKKKQAKNTTFKLYKFNAKFYN